MRVPYGGSLKGLYIRYSGFIHELAFTPLSVNELFKAVGFQKVLCIPEPEENNNLMKRFLKNLVKRLIGRLLSLEPDFIFSGNIICVGYKYK